MAHALAASLQEYHRLLEPASQEGWTNDGWVGACAAQALAMANRVLVETPSGGWTDSRIAVAGSLVGEVGDGLALVYIRGPEAFATGALPAEALLVRTVVANGLRDELKATHVTRSLLADWGDDTVDLLPFHVGRFARFGVLANLDELERREDRADQRFETDQDEVAKRLTKWIRTHKRLLERHATGEDPRSDKALGVLGEELRWVRVAIPTRELRGAASAGLLGLLVIRLLVRNLLVLMLAGPAVRANDALVLLPADYPEQALSELGLESWILGRGAS